MDKNMSLWDNIDTDSSMKNTVKFDLNKPRVLKFLDEKPTQLGGDDGQYLKFNVKEGEEDKILNTSAWTLIRELKKLMPIKDRTLVIEKKIDGGKQFFTVTPQ